MLAIPIAIKNMIKNLENAKPMFEAAYAAYIGINTAFTILAEKLSPEEFESAQIGVGRVMTEIILEIAQPILELHPELTPAGWKKEE